ncbi:MAG: hypothetical protein M3Q58_08825 [Bacteroidota bacterium]|nr:hypothetical protein [Bacteroidota bacterium]
MAQIIGDKKKGSIRQDTYYIYNNKQFVKSKSNLDKNRVMTDPAFENSRKSMTEFGACSLAASKLRTSLMPLSKEYGERSTWNRLVGTVQEIMLESKGKNNKGSISFSRFGYFFEGFNFNKSYKFDAVFLANHEVEYNETKGQVITKISAFDPSKFINFPKGSTHYRLLTAYCFMSDYKHNKKSNIYIEVVPEVNGQSKIKYSPLLALNISAQKSITIKNSTKVNPFPKNTGLVIFIGIEFYKQEGNRFYNLENRKAMKVLTVFRCGSDVLAP